MITTENRKRAQGLKDTNKRKHNSLQLDNVIQLYLCIIDKENERCNIWGSQVKYF